MEFKLRPNKEFVMNDNQVSGKWNEVKGEIRSAWGKLTDDELEETKGDAQSIQGLIQQRYGEKEETIKEKISNVFDRFSFKKDQYVDKTKENLRH
jgi:uncharacterized protein YjbJ (UPF0337 family)